MTAEYAFLIALIRNQMDGTPFEIPKDLDLAALAGIARKHRLEPFVYLALENALPDGQVSEQLFGAYHEAVFRDAQFDYVVKQVKDALKKQGIEHVFMRGICLKQDYPVPALRTMSDVDVLIRSCDLPAIRKAMAPTGARACYGDGNHRNYIFPHDIELEFHPMLLHCGAPVGTSVNPGWQYVPQGQQGFCHEMSPEGFYLNIMCHFANHFFGGGAGIRFVLDIWVCRHLRKDCPDRAFIERELEQAGLLEFAQKIEQLAEIWFSGAPMVPELEEMAEYICTSGLHGREDRALLNAVCFSPRGTSFSALLGRAFYPKGDLENRFDWVQGRPWLKPVAWVVRAWVAVTRRFDRIWRWGKGTNRFSKEQIRQQREKLLRFGVNCKENG